MPSTKHTFYMLDILRISYRVLESTCRKLSLKIAMLRNLIKIVHSIFTAQFHLVVNKDQIFRLISHRAQMQWGDAEMINPKDTDVMFNF